ncbi:hypothetical protein [Xanthobacter versatilis]|uniref:Uncharacterized protein n=1 Tax=Xanthobacter autotrophicus (strain ATCC BAA-1158 / Py2) TaxID=78245 RepID=A7IP18_XANP2|nr:hypothetical protein Xaut_4543 [Xanthobacter autotrophicus Py2]
METAMPDPAERKQNREFHQPDTRTADGGAVKSAVRARQGFSTGRILTVLIVSLVLVVIGFAASYMGAV